VNKSNDLKIILEEVLKNTMPPADPMDIKMPGLGGDLPDLLHRLKPGRWTPAAVLIPVVSREEQLTVLLTQRAEDLKHHPGQISFPGGRIEHGDSGPAAAALRETHEEIGVDPGFVTVLGYLSNYLTVSGYSVTPVVGMLRPGFELRPDQVEATDAFEVPLEFLMDPANHVRRMRQVFDLLVPVYEIQYRDRNIWGATAGMIISLYEKLSLKNR
jgi:8-oxo-dGTP pyrophosphatase MutT (NUDIX family)